MMTDDERKISYGDYYLNDYSVRAGRSVNVDPTNSSLTMDFALTSGMTFLNGTTDQNTYTLQYEDGGDLFMNNNETTSSSPYLMAWPIRSAWIGVFTIMLVVATVGNALVAWIVLAHRRMKTVTNYFLVNLSLADLTMSLFNCVFNFTFMLNNHWPFGSVYCTISNVIANVTVAASVFTLVAISFDRYIAIVYPLRPRMSKSVARIAITFIWLSSFTLAIPCILYSQILSHNLPNGETLTICLMVWPDGLPNVSQSDFAYNICFTTLTYLIPTLVMGVCYSRMSSTLWRSQSIGEMNPRQVDSIRSKRKVVRMFIVIVLLFTFCWLPYHGYFVYQYIDSEVNSYRYVQHIFLAFYWLAMSNAMINPLVYYYMNPRFRRYFRTVICQCLCCYWARKRVLSPSGGPGTADGRGTDCGPALTGTQANGGGGNLNHSVACTSQQDTRTGRVSQGERGRRVRASNNNHSLDRRPVNRRQQIIRFTTRRMIIFQRITSDSTGIQQQQQAAMDIPLVHSTLLANAANRHYQVRNCIIPNSRHQHQVEPVAEREGLAVFVSGDNNSPSPPTNQTSYM